MLENILNNIESKYWNCEYWNWIEYVWLYKSWS